MNKVTTINLNGIAYQVEEGGYEAIAAYLKQAAAKLEGNPDKEEIMRDFEQAVAEKFQAFLSTTKNVVTSDEVQKVIDAMGPVDGGPTGSDAKASGTGSNAGAGASTGAASPRRLFRVHEGSFLMGVCSGLAVFFGVDVTLVRILFILLAIATSGGALFAYFLIAIFTPQAMTVAQAQSGQGRPFNANEFIQQAQENYSQFRDKREWKQWKRSMKYGIPPQGAGYPSGGYYMFPFINLLRIILLLVFVGALVSLIGHHAFFGVALPLGLPLWVAIVILFAVWQFVSFPLRWVKYKTYATNIPSVASYYSGRNMFWHTVSSIVWVAFLVLCGWLCYLYIPEVHTVFNTIGIAIQNVGSH